MKNAALVTVLAFFIAPAWGAPCSTTAPGSTPLEKAANGLSAGQWCEMTPAMLNFTQQATRVRDVLDGCGPGGGQNINQYSGHMAYDPSQGTAGVFFWFGTMHGSAFRGFHYDVGDNEFRAGPSPSSACGSSGTCQSDFETAPIPHCASCNATHAYDGNATDEAGNFYYLGFTNTGLWKITLPSTINKNYGDCAGGNVNTGALDYWGAYGPSGSLIALCGGTANNRVTTFDLATETWSDTHAILNYEGSSGNTNLHLNTHPGSGEVWVSEGGGGPNTGNAHFRIWLNNGTPTASTLDEPPSEFGPGQLQINNINVTPDPADTSGKFVVFDYTKDTVGTSNNGWWEFDMGTDTWTTFAALGITSMPPLYTNHSHYEYTPVMSSEVPELGVIVYFSYRDDEGADDGGLFVYRHTDGSGSGEVDPPAPPANPQPF